MAFRSGFRRRSFGRFGGRRPFRRRRLGGIRTPREPGQGRRGWERCYFNLGLEHTLAGAPGEYATSMLSLLDGQAMLNSASDGDPSVDQFARRLLTQADKGFEVLAVQMHLRLELVPGFIEGPPFDGGAVISNQTVQVAVALATDNLLEGADSTNFGSATANLQAQMSSQWPVARNVLSAEADEEGDVDVPVKTHSIRQFYLCPAFRHFEVVAVGPVSAVEPNVPAREADIRQRLRIRLGDKSGLFLAIASRQAEADLEEPTQGSVIVRAVGSMWYRRVT